MQPAKQVQHTPQVVLAAAVIVVVTVLDLVRGCSSGLAVRRVLGRWGGECGLEKRVGEREEGREEGKVVVRVKDS